MAGGETVGSEARTLIERCAKIVESVEVLADGSHTGAELAVLRYAAKLVREQKFDGPAPGEPGSHWP